MKKKIITYVSNKTTALVVLFCIQGMLGVQAQNGGAKWLTEGNSLSTGEFLGSTNDFPLIFKINSMETMRLSTSGFLGIGLNTPTVPLDVQGDARFRGNTMIDNYLSVTGNIYATGFLDAQGNSRFRTNLLIDSNLTVVGTLSSGCISTSCLHVAGQTLFDSLQVTGNVSSTGTILAHAFAGNSDYVIQAPDSTERMRILQTTGQVGIGLNSPEATLHIRDTMPGAFPATTGTTQTALLRLAHAASNGVLDMGINGGNGAWLQVTNRTGLQNNYALLLNPNGGNVGIGTTSPTEKLEVSGGNILVSGVQNPLIMLKSNATGTPYGFLQYDKYDDPSGNGYLRLYDGTAYCMTWRGGKVGIGTFSPTEKLEVAGNIKASGTVTANAVSVSTLFTTGKMGVGLSSPEATIHVQDTMPSALPATTGTTQTALLRMGHSASNGVLDMGVNDGNGAWLQVTNRIALQNNYSLLLNPNGGSVGIGTTTPVGKFHVNNDVVGSDSSFVILTNGRTGVGTSSPVGKFQMSDSSFIVFDNGNIGINTTSVPTGFKMAVDGKIMAQEVKIRPRNKWADFVFDDNYKLTSLKQLEDYIQQNKHLPEIPTSSEVEANGVSVGEMQAKLLQKIEELSLYVIQQNKEIEMLKLQMKQVQNK